METAHIDFNHWLGSQIGNTIQENVNTLGMLQLINQLQPKFTRSNLDCYFTYGGINGTIEGHGKTPYEAMCDFSRNFYGSNPSNQPTEK